MKIIEQMSPDEAMVMYQFRDRESWFMRYPKSKGVIQSRFPVQSLANPAEFLACIEHLEALNLLKLPGSKSGSARQSGFFLWQANRNRNPKRR